MEQRSNDSTLVYSSENPSSGRAKTAGIGRTPQARSAGGKRAETTAPATKPDGIVRVWLERKGRNGKPVSIIRGLALDATALGTLASRLKRVCGSGGTAKDGEIIIQGDHRKRIATELESDGHRVKLAGG